MRGQIEALNMCKSHKFPILPLPPALERVGDGLVWDSKMREKQSRARADHREK